MDHKLHKARGKITDITSSPKAEDTGSASPQLVIPNRAVMKDDETAAASHPNTAAEPKRRAIVPVDGDAVADESAAETATGLADPAPQPEPAAASADPKPAASKPADSESATPPRSSDAPAETPTSGDDAPSQPAAAEQSAAAPASGDEPAAESAPAEQPAKDTPKAPDNNQETEETAKAVQRERELQEYIANRKYFVPINAAARKRSIKVSLLLTLVVLLLGFILIDLMLDTGIILLVQKIPHTHFFNLYKN